MLKVIRTQTDVPALLDVKQTRTTIKFVQDRMNRDWTGEEVACSVRRSYRPCLKELYFFTTRH